MGLLVTCLTCGDGNANMALATSEGQSEMVSHTHTNDGT